MPKGFKKEFTNPMVQKLFSHGTYERRTVEQVKVYVVLNDPTALVLLPDLKDNVDLRCDFVSDDAQFHEWCLDYHKFMWNIQAHLPYQHLGNHSNAV
jgi:hypothetical protein